MRRASLILLVFLCSALWWVTEKEAVREGLHAKEVEAVDNGRKFCRLVLPRLESFFETNGFYPYRIETVLTATDHVPGILGGGGNRNWYRVVDDGEGFEFRMQGRSEVSGRRFSMVWESRTGRWRMLDDE